MPAPPHSEPSDRAGAPGDPCRRGPYRAALACTVLPVVAGAAMAVGPDRATTPGEAVAALLVVTVLLVGERAATSLRHRRQLADAIRLAHIDDLTGLVNRRALLAVLDDPRAADTPARLVLIDLDRFKAVNDDHGHPAGDHVLQVVANRLSQSTDPGCLVARLGGDEFAVLIHDSHPAAVTRLAGRVRAALARPVPVAPGRQVTVGASIGAAFRSGAGTTAADLLRQADTAMYRAKTANGADQSAGSGPVDPPGHARAAAESLRRLNQDVVHGRSYIWPSQIGSTVDYLRLLTRHLTTTLTEAGQWLEEQHTNDRVRQHMDPQAAPAVEAALAALTSATATNQETTRALTSALHHTTGLTGHPFGDTLH